MSKSLVFTYDIQFVWILVYKNTSFKIIENYNLRHPQINP